MKVSLPEKEFEKIRAKKTIKPEEANDWLKNCVVGKISKSELDLERNKETNALDMMQNSSIIYHMESLLEMQILCLVSCFISSRF